ncbi:DsbA family protein [Corynebacterium kutscheri]|uniref:DsbA family protein n=1 Tax=Corynebacterium kutscheri TaxID=35755 RepID=UPI0037BFF7F1
MWALVTVIVLLALAVGYLLGERGTDQTASGTNTATTANNAAASPTAEAGTVAAMNEDDVATLAAKATPGTQFSDGTGNAQIFGPSGEITSQDDVLKVHRRSMSDPFGIGALDAPVVISEFSDFECPFCSRHQNQTHPTIMAKYVNTGLVRVEWNDLPVNGPNAVEAAKAGRAAAAQGKFHEYKAALYKASQSVNGHPHFTIDDFVGFAQQAGVPDIERFRTEATNGTYNQAVMQASQYATGIGLTGTPSFFVGDQFVSGAQPLEVFEEIIQQQLAKVANGEIEVPAANA